MVSTRWCHITELSISIGEAIYVTEMEMIDDWFSELPEHRLDRQSSAAPENVTRQSPVC